MVCNNITLDLLTLGLERLVPEPALVFVPMIVTSELETVCGVNLLIEFPFSNLAFRSVNVSDCIWVTNRDFPWSDAYKVAIMIVYVPQLDVDLQVRPLLP